MKRFFWNKRMILGALGVAVFLLAVAPGVVYADQSGCGYFDVRCKLNAGIAESIYGSLSDIAFWISNLIARIAGVAIALLAWALQVILNLSLNIVNSAPVKIGFPIVLAFANLAFVAGMIVIAIATILRQESYGVKKILWKLVVMAIMVNFGLVIAGALLSVSDNVTLFFIESVNPAGAGSDFGTFAGALAGAFNPHGVLTKPQDIIEDPTGSSAALTGAVWGEDLGKFLLPFAAVLSTIGALTIIIITLGTLVVALLYRYVKIGMLLITLPLAWAAWVFPTYEKHYKTWWDSFTKWAIFPPVVVFFLWIALKTSEVMNDARSEFNFTQYQSPSGNDAWAAIANFFTGLFSPLVEQVLRIIILWGIMMGGLMAASSLGVKVADAGVKMAEGAGGWLKGKAGHYTKRGLRAGYQRGVGPISGRWLERALIKNKTLGAPIANLGRAIQGFTQKGGSGVVEQEKKQMEIARNDTDRAKQLEEAMRLPQALAVLSQMGDLGKVKKIGNQDFHEWLRENQQKISDYGQHDLEKKLRDMGLQHDKGKNILGALGGKDVAASQVDLNDLKNQVGEAMGDGDPRQLAALLKNNALSLPPEKLALLQQAMVQSIGKAFSPDQFADFTAGLDVSQKKNLIGAMNTVFAGDASRAADALGPDNMDLIRDSGQMQGRGITSEIWGEPRRAPLTPTTAGTPAAPAAPTPTPTPPPAAPPSPAHP